MIAKLTFGLVRDFESGEFFEKYFLSAIFSILAIRTFLHLFGYPQLGEGQFHIAHILWGGFFMMFAIILLLGFLNRNAKSWAAILGGLGSSILVGFIVVVGISRLAKSKLAAYEMFKVAIMISIF